MGVMKTCILPVLMLLVATASCSPSVPENWKRLGIPSEGLVKVYDHSDANGFYADYTGTVAADLSNQVARRLTKLGFAEVCSKFAGAVKGFENRDRKYIVKVDELGGRVGLSVCNENGAEPLLYGICFKGYTLGDPTGIQ